MASFPQPVKTSYPPAYIQSETDFSTSQVTPSSPLETLPIDLMQKIGSLLEVVELGRLSCVGKSLHTITTQHMWPHQLSFFDSSVASKFSPRQRVQNVYFAVYGTCPEIFVKSFGIKFLVKMKIENKELLPESANFLLTPHLRTIFKTEKIIRRSDFSAFMFPCIFNKNNSFVAISTHKIPNALKFFFWSAIGCVQSMNTFYLTPQTELDLKNFFKSGSMKFDDDDMEFQLPPEVLPFFLEA
ncbi:MAG: hypothetical protein V4494_03815 [Chlamydiota bacterium]